MDRPITDMGLLRKRFKQLTDRSNTSRRLPEEIEALAECTFRIALSKGTPAREALNLLKRAHKLDGINPKYAYHIARIYFIHGNLDKAVSWLQASVRQCPTSHRLWAHVALFQRELNERYRGKEEYEPDDLRRRSVQVDALILDGAERFERSFFEFSPSRNNRTCKTKDESLPTLPGTPGDSTPEGGVNNDKVEFPSNVRRLTDAGKCRWNGVRDLTMEDLLQGGVGDYTRNQILPYLNFAARVAESRRGGVSAFAILAIEWLVSGHPAETALRLRKTLPRIRETPSLALLDLALKICTEEPAKAQHLLAEALAEGHIPPLLAALLHHRVLLTGQLEFPGARKYRIACRFLSEMKRQPPSDEESKSIVNEQAQLLAIEIEAVTQKVRPGIKKTSINSNARPDFFPARPLSLDVLDGLDHTALNLVLLCDETARILNQRLSVDLRKAEEAAQLLTDRTAAGEIQKELKCAAESSSESLDELLMIAFADSDNCTDLNGIMERSARCRQALNHVLYSTAISGPLRQIDNELASASDVVHVLAPPVSSELRDILSAIPQVLLSLPGADKTCEISHIDRINVIEKQANEIEDELKKKWDQLSEIVKTQKRGEINHNDLEACKKIRHYVEWVEKNRESALKQLEEARAENPGPRPETLQVLDKTVTKLQNIQTGRFKANLKKIPIPISLQEDHPQSLEAPKDPTTPFSRSPTEPLADSTRLTVAGSTPALNSGSQGSKELPGIALLEDAVERTKNTIEELFQSAYATFDAYPETVKKLTPIRALQMSILARQAETFYRMGRRHDARAIWVNLSRKDRLDANILKNIAVCDSHGPEFGRAFSSWRAYAEMLYFYDVVAGSPRPNAQKRAEFHREFGSAFMPPALFAVTKDGQPKKVDEQALISFLDTPSRVRLFVNHKLLEFFNAKFNFTSPPLILGIRRTEGESIRQSARQNLLTFVEELRLLLPERIQEAFADTVRRHIEAGFEACSSARRLTHDHDPDYAKEESRQESWIKDICLIKYLIFTAVRDSRQLPKSLTSLDFITYLRKLDCLPISHSPGFIKSEVRRFKQESESLAGMMAHLLDQVMNNLLRFIFGVDGDASEESLRKRQYRKLIDTWIRQALLTESEWPKRIDDPQQYYPEHVRAVLDNQHSEQVESALVTLRMWTDLYPELTGPARWLCILLANRKQFEEAIAVLERAGKAGFLAEGRQHCHDLLEQLIDQRDDEALSAGFFEKVLPSLLDRLSRDDSKHKLAQKVIYVSLEIAKQTKKNQNHSLIAKAVEAWLSRARAKLKMIDTESKKDDLNEEDIQSVLDNLNMALMQMFLIPVGELGENTNWANLAKAMTSLLSAYPHIVDAYYYRMVAWYRQAVKTSEAKDRVNTLEFSRHALADSKIVKSKSRIKDHRQEAEKVSSQIEEFLSGK